MALEEAGELQEAARVFEYAGEHAQAALLRLEHAKTLRDPGERLDVLREGSARNPGQTPESSRLHGALARALLEASEQTEDIAQRRALQLEAASALEAADEPDRAGEIYEALGLLRRAATAYQNAGALERLELVLEVIDRADQHLEAQRNFERDIEQSIAEGRRRYAHLQLLDRADRPQLVPLDAPRSSATTSANWVRLLNQLETRLLTRTMVDLRWGDGQTTAIRGVSRFRIGRAPDADLVVPGPTLSRHHVELTLDHQADRPRLMATDLGSRVGTFWDGDPLVPGEPLALSGPGELALGVNAAFEVHPVGDRDATPIGAFIRAVGEPRGWWLYLPGGGPLWLAPDIRVPARILFDRGYVVLDFAARLQATLQDRILPGGTAIELMVGDRLSIVGVPLVMEVLG